MKELPVNVSWGVYPTVGLSLVVYFFAYLYRWRQVRINNGPKEASYKHLAFWMLGLLSIFIALGTPIDSAADQLASMHMTQHLFLADMAPVGLMLALTKVQLRPVTKLIVAVERKAGWLASPAFGVIFYVGIMWVYHIPPVYNLAQTDNNVHSFGHMGFFLSGILYWWHLLSPVRSRRALNGMMLVAYMAVTKILVGAVGVLLTFYPKLAYSVYDVQGKHWGMTPLVDQSVAGAIMGLEQGIVMGIGLSYLFIRMLRESEAADARRDRYEPD